VACSYACTVCAARCGRAPQGRPEGLTPLACWELRVDFTQLPTPSSAHGTRDCFFLDRKPPLVSHAWCDTTPPRQTPSAEINTSVATNSTVPRTPPGRCSGDAKSKGTRQQREERSRKMHREMNAMHTMCRSGLHQGITASPSPSHPHLLIHSPPHPLTSSLHHPLTSHPLASSPPLPLTSSTPHPLTPSTPHPLTCSPPHPLTPSTPPSLSHLLTSSSSYRLH